MTTGTRSLIQMVVMAMVGVTAISARAERAILSYRSTDISSAEVSAASRTHRIRLNPEALAARHFEFTTPEGITYIANPSRRSARSLAEGETFTVSGDLVAADDSADVGSFTMAYTGRGLHGALSLTDRSLVVDGDTLREIKTEDFPGCAGSPDAGDHSRAQHATHEEKAPVVAKDLVTIDVMIAFSNSYARLSQAQLEAFAASAIDSANVSYVNSGINQRLRLVDTYLTDYTESGDLTKDLSRLYEPGDGYLDEIQSRREEKGADLVSLIVESMNYCGIAYLMSTPSSAFRSLGLSVVNYSCAVGNLSFAHELGHNMGAMHANPEAGNATGAYSYSFGSRFIGSNGIQYRDIMAYAPGIRVTQFSNPDVSYLGAPTGTATANVALTLNNTAGIIASYYGDDQGAAPTPTPTPSSNFSISGTILDAVGQPISGAKVELRYSLNGKKRSVKSMAKNGSYALEGIKSGASYQLKITLSNKRYVLQTSTASGTLTSDTTHNFTATLARTKGR